jgi:hypothetical protein
MKRTLALSLLSIVVLSGCGKKSPAPEPVTTKPSQGTSLDSMLNKPAVAEPAPAAEAAPAAAAPETAPLAAAPEQPPTDPKMRTEGEAAFEDSTEFTDLSKHLQIFVHQKNRFPKDITELLRFAGMATPRLPAGYTMVMDKESTTVMIVKPKGK